MKRCISAPDINFSAVRPVSSKLKTNRANSSSRDTELYEDFEFGNCSIFNCDQQLTRAVVSLILVCAVVIISVPTIVLIQYRSSDERSAKFTGSAQPQRVFYDRAVETDSLIVYLEDLKYRIASKRVIIDLSFESLKAKHFSILSLDEVSQENVKELILKSPLTQNTLHYILQRFSKIERLEIDVDAVCIGLRFQAAEVMNTTPIYLEQLVYLNLKNSVYCPAFEWGFQINSPKLSAVQISHCRLNPDNFKTVYNNLEKFKSSLNELHISNSYICSDKKEEYCGVNKLKFECLEKLKVTSRIEDEQYFLNNILSTSSNTIPYRYK